MKIINIIIYWTGFVSLSFSLFVLIFLLWRAYRKNIIKAYETTIKMLTFVNEINRVIFYSVLFAGIMFLAYVLLDQAFPIHEHLKLLK